MMMPRALMIVMVRKAGKAPMKIMASLTKPLRPGRPRAANSAKLKNEK
jgi:hypothetical protein